MIIMIIKGQKYLILLAIIANFPVGQSVSFTPETAINQEPATWLICKETSIPCVPMSGDLFPAHCVAQQY